ncbi:MAG: hypothetical protein GQ547_01345 [Methylophaga sp.]|nr:hypothetical protein [Methylophaga sp.]
MRFLISFILFVIPAIGTANNSVNVSIGQWSFEDMNAQNLKVDMTLTAKGIGFTASADSVQLAQPIGNIKKIKLNCKELLIVSEKYMCSRGHISFHQKELGLQKLDFELEALPGDEKYKLEIENLNLASAFFSVTFIIKHDKWKLFADTPQLQLSSLINFLSPYLQPDQLKVLANWSIEGDLKLDLDLFGQANQLNALELDLVSKEVNVSDSEGLYVSEGLASTWAIEAERVQQGWQWKIDVATTAGQAYVDPIFLDLSETPLKINAQGQWLQDKEEISVSHAEVTQENITDIKASGSASFSQINNVKIEVGKSELTKLYPIWIQPFVVGTALDNMELAGSVDFQYEKQAANYHLSVGFDKVFVDDQAQRFGIDDVSGTLAWSNYEHVKSLALNWQNAYVYAIPLGKSTIRANVQNSSLALEEPWLLPILDGELQLNNFSLHNPGDDNLEWTFEGALTPISMESLSAALEWPLMHGKLSGIIPHVSYADHKVEVDGALKVKLFEGVTIIRDLRLDKPFGSLPQLQANIDMKGLNLEVLTQTFDFGKITGKLDGKVTNFRLSNWQPVYFDAKFATPEGDKSRRKISQKAVDNLSQIGGGAAGVLQRSFLRFFEDFSYQRLGLSCKLRNDICEMSGVGDAKQGYYIVKGGGLPPRINVVGYTRRVDWPDLIERLKAVSESSGPVIK